MEKELVLDYSIWRCGGHNNPNSLGKGMVMMHNEEGYECCLGQFARQMVPVDYSDRKRAGCGTPATLAMNFGIQIPPLTEKVEPENVMTSNTVLACTAMNINDAVLTTPEEKITQLKDLFGVVGYNIKVINKPI